MLKLNLEYIKDIDDTQIKAYDDYVKVAHDNLHNKKGQGSEFTGWLNLPTDYDKEEFNRIKTAANKIKNDSKILLVIGIGGSYLGAKAAIDFTNNYFYNNQKCDHRNGPRVYFVGNNISSTYIADLEQLINDSEHDFSINVISKSGTTTEPAIAFRHFKNLLVKKYGKEEANNRIYVTTDKEKGALKEQADSNNWQSFIVPDDIGGRFSVLTAVGLLPIAATGVDIDALMIGAKEAQDKYNDSNVLSNDSYKYAVLRNILFKKGYGIEMLIGYEPNLLYFNEWFKQLYGESQGKNNTGIFPASAVFSADLHSMGQYIQEGKRNLFETVLHIKNVKKDVTIQKEEVDGDGLNYLAGKTVSYVNDTALKATAIAHTNGGVPNMILEVEDMSEKSLGHLIYFFELSCALDGYLLGVNPFDQPGVEEYKKNMFALLGKKGFEDIKNKILKKS